MCVCFFGGFCIRIVLLVLPFSKCTNRVLHPSIPYINECVEVPGNTLTHFYFVPNSRPSVMACPRKKSYNYSGSGEDLQGRGRWKEKSRRGESAVFSLSSFAFGSSIKISLTFYEPKDSELTLLYLLHSPGWNGQYIKCDNGLNARLPFLCPLIFMDNYLKNCHSLKVHTIRTYLWSVKV